MVPLGSRRQQTDIDDYFDSAVGYWKNVYESGRLRPLIYKRRREIALHWIAELTLSPAARILDVGCGAGMLAADMAFAGYSVDAIDTAPAMVTMARERAMSAGVTARLTTAVGDAHALVFSDRSFDLVVALGVLPWLHSEAQAIAEMLRVLIPGGYLLITADNESRLDRLLDPISTPLLAPLRETAKTILPGAWTTHRSSVVAKRHRPAEIDRLLSLFGIEKVRSETLGFWPLTFCGREIFSDPISVRIDRFLRALAERNFPGLHTTGSQYLVLAQKPRG